MTHSIDIRIYYEDTDAGGIVYYANYLKFCERGRTELLRCAGFENKPLMERDGFMFVVRHVEADYIAPACLDDVVRVETSVTAVKNASFAMKQTVFRPKDNAECQVLFEMNVTLACVGTNGKPVRLPEKVKEALNND
ncbi:MAG: tol-pal system-associated acyl-CoA thioesterase [Rhodospirillales bacterium]|nr:tol-pal system-associated acyl-CoA thioesterase [Rhodospirillales bacterium]MCB9995724.1 tol-pal system-associated acyl-CoA thioesterase [Rhodospirillales bacterium]